MAARLVPATMTLFNRVQARMLPTPAKFHYLFNMRDLSKASGGVVWRCAAGLVADGQAGKRKRRCNGRRRDEMPCTARPTRAVQHAPALFLRPPTCRCSRASSWPRATASLRAPAGRLAGASPRPRATCWRCGPTSAAVPLPTSLSRTARSSGWRARLRSWRSRYRARGRLGRGEYPVWRAWVL